MFKTLLSVLFISLTFLSTAQISVQNGSFEDEPRDASVPMGWSPCERGSTPDILPGFWGVYNESSHGETYIGLITREDGSWENIGQRLSEPVRKGRCYNFKVDLAHSNTYTGYNMPARFRVWGGRTKCSKDQLLAETNGISHTEWKTYDFTFRAKQKYNYIIIEAYYIKGLFVDLKGNILIDNFTKILPCNQAFNAIELDWNKG